MENVRDGFRGLNGSALGWAGEVRGGSEVPEAAGICRGQLGRGGGLGHVPSIFGSRAVGCRTERE